MATITTGILLQEVMVNMVVPTVLATLPLVIFVQQAGIFQQATLLANLAPLTVLWVVLEYIKVRLKLPIDGEVFLIISFILVMWVIHRWLIVVFMGPIGRLQQIMSVERIFWA